MAKGKQEIVIDEDAVFGNDPQGFLALLDKIHARTLHEDQRIKLEAYWDLTEKAFNYAEQKMFEIFGINYNLNDVRSAISKMEESPQLSAVLRLIELKEKYEHFAELYFELGCLRNLTTRRLPNNHVLRASFGKIVGYKSIPLFEEYQVMFPGDKEVIEEKLISEIKKLFGTFYMVFVAIFKEKLQSLRSEAGLNAAYLATTSPEAYAELEERLQAGGE